MNGGFLGLADEMKKVGENMVASYDVRIGAVGDVIKGTHSMLKNFHQDRIRMGEEQRAELVSFKKDLVNETTRMLNTFKNNFEKMAQELDTMLSNYYKQDIQKPVHSMLTTYHNQMKALAGEFRKVHEAWMGCVRSMNAKRMKHVPEEASAPAPKATKKRKYSRRK